jgi:hypothetical protein
MVLNTLSSPLRVFSSSCGLLSRNLCNSDAIFSVKTEIYTCTEIQPLVFILFTVYKVCKDVAMSLKSFDVLLDNVQSLWGNDIFNCTVKIKGKKYLSYDNIKE